MGGAMLVVEGMLTYHDISGAVALGGAIHSHNNIEENGTSENNTQNNTGWDLLEW